ncbi:cytochrome C [Zhengella mangrovi]|uniref:Cytochrome C n=1 Tax=Zhengella mangrovi TaxID=1982044 RepID=A0A2G1QIW8_9HYPH|nr:cytochrome c [Zhengella mangrovi]PHP65158.1 cytochrome C [Zhengella mangrovi]
MIRKLAVFLVLLAVAGGLAFWFITAPKTLSADEIAALPQGDAAAGERIFYAAGCAACHAAPGAKGDEKLVLAGGERFVTQFGTFVAPNISPDPRAGIGSWTLGQFANAVLRGVSPAGEHLYPAFPYSTYERMTGKDLSDLFAFLKTLPPVTEKAPPHEVSFPFNIRRLLGGWKWLFLREGFIVDLPADATDQLRRGRYLVEALGHCGECHTPRNVLGGPEYASWLKGGPSPDGKGKIPDITPSGIGSWSAKDIAYYLESGFTPEFDSVGGAMVAVQENMAKLPAEDRDAIAAYLKALPASGG